MIFFDIDETLLDFKGAEYLGVAAIYQEWQKHFNESQDHFYARWCTVGKHYFSRYLAGELTFEEQQIARVQDLFRATCQTVSETQALAIFHLYLTNFQENWTAFSDVWPCLQSLAGHQLGIISNGQTKQQQAKLEKLGIRDYFEVIVTAEDTGFAKPHVAIFRAAAAKAGIPQEQCTYCGDDWTTDMMPLASAGMQGIWINRRGETAGSLGNIQEIHSLTELAHHL